MVRAKFPNHRFFAVASLTTGKVIYTGPSERMCAEYLEPGTVWAGGYDCEQDAVDRVMQELDRFRSVLDHQKRKGI